MSNLLLEIRNLQIDFPSENGPKTVVKNFNLTLRRGELHGIVGESGSGKSVTMLSVCRLVNNAQYPAGEIILNREDGTSIDLLQTQDLQAIRGKHISYIFQEPMTALNPLLTCGKQVAESMKNYDPEKIKALFEKVKLPDPECIYNSYPHQISGGQRQRVMIAMAIANQPALLIADEPTTALDASVQHEVLTLIKEICRAEQMSLVFISHDLEVVKNLTERITVMYRGEVVEQGHTADIMQNPQHPYTKALMAIKPSYKLQGQFLPTLDKLLQEPDYKPSRWPDKTPTEDIGMEVHTLNKSFSKKNVLNKIEFNVFRGESLGIVGESGCGKSTLARILVKLHQADCGEVLFEGESIIDLGKHYRRKVQMIFQDPYSSLNPRMTAGETLIEPMQVHQIGGNQSERKQKALSLLEAVGLSSAHWDSYPHQFSGGQRQRLCIARALSVDPSLIICDESVSALDVSVQAQILNLLKDLQQRFGLTYLFISHDLQVVTYFCNRVMVLNKGEISSLQTTAQLMENPGDAYTAKLLSYLNL